MQALVDARAAARAARDLARADALRAELEAAGWEVIDWPDGSTVRRRTGAAAYVELTSRSRRGRTGR